MRSTGCSCRREILPEESGRKNSIGGGGGEITSDKSTISRNPGRESRQRIKESVHWSAAHAGDMEEIVSAQKEEEEEEEIEEEARWRMAMSAASSVDPGEKDPTYSFSARTPGQ